MKITNNVTTIENVIDVNVGDVFYNKEIDEIALITSIADGYALEDIPIGLFFFHANHYEDLTEGYILDPNWVKVSAELTLGKDDPVRGYYIKPSEWVYKKDGHIMAPLTNEEFANKFSEFFVEGEE